MTTVIVLNTKNKQTLNIMAKALSKNKAYEKTTRLNQSHSRSSQTKTVSWRDSSQKPGQRPWSEAPSVSQLLKWEGHQKRGDICIGIADSLCCTVETNNIVKQPHANKIFKRSVS